MTTFCPARQTVSPKTQSCTGNKEKYRPLKKLKRNFRRLWYTIHGAILPKTKGSRERCKNGSLMKLKIPVLLVKTRSFGDRKGLWFRSRFRMHCACSNKRLSVDSAIHLTSPHLTYLLRVLLRIRPRRNPCTVQFFLS